MRRRSAEEDFKRLVKNHPTTYFFFMDRIPLAYAIMIGSLFKNIFFKPANYYQMLSVTYLRRNLDKKRKSDLIKK